MASDIRLCINNLERLRKQEGKDDKLNLQRERINIKLKEVSINNELVQK